MKRGRIACAMLPIILIAYFSPLEAQTPERSNEECQALYDALVENAAKSQAARSAWPIAATIAKCLCLFVVIVGGIDLVQLHGNQDISVPFPEACLFSASLAALIALQWWI